VYNIYIYANKAHIVLWHRYCLNIYNTLKNKKNMQNIRNFMIKYPLLSIAMLFPICLIIITGVMSIIIKFVLPIVLAFWLSSIIYTSIIGKNSIKYYSKPLWFIRYR
jgi:hypothetical protein